MLILHPITARGKQIISEFGSEWVILKTENKVQFSPLTGPWYFAKPITTDVSRAVRWVHHTDDKHFIVEINK